MNEKKMELHPSNTIIGRWADLVVNHRIKVLLLTLVALAVFINGMGNLKFRNASNMWFSSDDPVLENYAELKNRFGDTQYFSVGLSARPGEQDVFSYETLQVINEITIFLENHPYVTKVQSLANYQYIHSDNDTLTTSYLVDDFETLEDTPQTMRQLANVMAEETMVHDLLITPDLKHTLIQAETVYIEDDIQHHVKLINDLNKFLERQDYESRGYELHFFGRALISHQMITLSMFDQGALMLLLYGLIALSLGFLFRSLTGIGMPLLVVIATVIFTLGFFGLMNWPLSIISAQISIVITSIAIADSVHIMVEYYHWRNQGLDTKRAAKNAVTAKWKPCFFTSVTTLAGFLSLSVTDLVPMRQYGYAAAFGVGMAFLLSVIALPALLSFFSMKQKSARRISETGHIARMTGSVEAVAFKYRSLLIGGGAVATVLFVAFSLQLSTDANFANTFKESSKIRQDFQYFDDTYRGGQLFDFIIDSGSEGGVKDPEFLGKVNRLISDLDGMQYVGKPLGMVNYVRKMNQSMHNDDKSFFVLPETRELVAQYLLLYENSGPEEDLSDLKSSDERFLRIMARIKNMTTEETTALEARIRELLKNEYQDLNVKLAGDLILFNKVDYYIAQGIVASMSVAILILFACLFAVFRSLKYSIIGLVTSVVPLFSAGALMYFMGLPVEGMTLVIASVTIGVCVDDSIHILSHYLDLRKMGYSVRHSMDQALTRSGRAVVMTSLILFFGFSVMLLGSMLPTVHFGLFSAFIIVVALIGDLLFLPAFVYLFDKEMNQESTDAKTSESVQKAEQPVAS